jgi:PAS domain S-box-containing protein
VGAGVTDPSPRILIVDDVEANLVALEATLEPLAASVVRANSGKEALLRLLEGEFALILMDVQMPELDGLETARLIKKRTRTSFVPIIFITAISREMAHVFRGYDTGAVDYLLKPIDPVILRTKVSVFLELYNRGEELKRQAALLREREREALERRSEQRYRALMESIPHGVLAARPDGKVTFCNEQWLQMTGLSCADRMDVCLRKTVHPDDLALATERWTAAVDRAEPFEIQLRLHLLKGDAWRWHLVRGVAERNEHGAVVGWIISATDIHEQREAQSALQEAIQARDDFLAAASHELRTPLTAARLQAQGALRTLDTSVDAEVLRALRGNLKQIERMTHVVENMLDLSRVKSGRLLLERRVFDLVPLLRDACDAARTMSSRHDIQLHAPERLEIDADRERMDQVMTNLLTNAIRYSPQGGPVDVRAETVAGFLRLTVSDRGLGIEPAKQAIIFERFGQAHGINYGGMGLGLTISRGIIEQHGGTISVRSAGLPGQGSTFEIRLPLAPGAPPRPQDRHGDARDHPRRGDTAAV